MTNKQEHSHFQIDLDQGGSVARRRTELLPDGAYLFADELNVRGILTTTLVTCAAWLLELYEMRAGEIFFISGKEHIHPRTKCFGVLYPSFSVTRPCFKNVKGHLLGFASTVFLPTEFTTAAVVFDCISISAPSSVADVIKVLKAGSNHRSVELNPKASLLSLKAKRLIDKSYLVYLSISRIAERLAVTPEHLSRQFKRDFGMSPTAYLHKLRVADAPLRLARGEDIVNVSQDVGYNDLSRFYKHFRKTTHTSPGACKTMLRPPHN